MALKLLPGQQMIGTVSNFLAGTNLCTDYASNTLRNTPAIQAQVKAAGFRLVRCQIPAGSSNAYIDQTYNACVACGSTMLTILTHNNPSWNQSLVSYLGSRCNLYEYANEPDLYPASGAQYYAWWAAELPALRKINPNAAFIGPVLGVFANFNGFVSTWLTSCKQANDPAVLPDAVSFHIYPCTGDSSQTHCATRATAFSGAYQQADALVKMILGNSLPLCMTEWNIDAANPPQAYTLDPTFNATWTKAAMQNLAQAGYAMACQFDAGSNAGGGKLDLISTNAPYSPQVQYQPIKDAIATLFGGGGVTPTPVVSGTLPATDTFARADQSGWGNASDGQTWGADAASAAFTISKNTGVVSGAVAGIYSATLGASNATDASVLCAGQLSAFGGSNLGVVLRFTDANNWYKAYLDGANLVIQKKVAGTTTVLSQVPFAATGSTPYMLRFQVQGNALSASAWLASGGQEPGIPMVSASDTSIGAGACGLRCQLAASVSATYTSFAASAVGSPAPPPPPPPPPPPSQDQVITLTNFTGTITITSK